MAKPPENHAGHGARPGRAALLWARVTAEPAILAAALIAALAILAFAKIADEVREAHTFSFDDRFLDLLRKNGEPGHAVGPEWLTGVMRDFSALGSAAVVSLVVLSTVGYLAIQRRRRAAWTIIAASVGGTLIAAALKLTFSRPRPDLAFHLTEVDSTSFPSGHSMESAVVYLTLGAMLARLTPGTRGKVFVLGAALCITGLVGFSRAFLGVHYATDVLGGWSAGLAWALVCWIAARKLRRDNRPGGDVAS